MESFPVDTPTPVDSVRVLVMENIMLSPSSDVYILPLSYVDYVVERRKYGRVEILSVPSEQYKFKVANETVGYVIIRVRMKYTHILVIAGNYHRKR